RRHAGGDHAVSRGAPVRSSWKPGAAADGTDDVGRQSPPCIDARGQDFVHAMENAIAESELFGTTSAFAECQPAPSTTTMACTSGASELLIIARCRFITSVSQAVKTRPTCDPASGFTAPKR